LRCERGNKISREDRESRAISDRQNQTLSIVHLPQILFAVSCANSISDFAAKTKHNFVCFDFLKFVDLYFLMKTEPMTRHPGAIMDDLLDMAALRGA
jgi:hypothetical protein